MENLRIALLHISKIKKNYKPVWLLHFDCFDSSSVKETIGKIKPKSYFAILLDIIES